MRAATVGVMAGVFTAVAVGLGTVGATPAGAQIRFGSCAEAYALGWGDIEPDEPGYALELDRDRDGFACELNGDDDLPDGGTTTSTTSTTTSTTSTTPSTTSTTTPTTPSTAVTTSTAVQAAGAASTTTVLYANCSAAAAVGVFNIRSTDAGYRPALDSDQDGIACESTAVAAAVLPFTGARDVTWIVGGAAVGLGLAWTVSSRRRLRPLS